MTLTFCQATAIFIEELTIAKLSPNTLKGYQADLNGIAKYIAEDPLNMPLKSITPMSIHTAFSLFAQTHSTKSVARCRATWQHFDNVLYNHRLIDTQFTTTLPKTKVPKSLPKPIYGWNETAVQKLLMASKDINNANTKALWPKRDFLIVSLLMGLGLRVGELISLTTTSYTGQTCYKQLSVIGKGAKQRILPLPQPLEQVIDDYITERATYNVNKLTPLFIKTPVAKSTISPLTADNVRYILRTIAKLHQLQTLFPKGALAHSLRHTFGSIMADSGTNIIELAKLMGHESAATTQNYIDITGNAKRDIMLCSPIIAEIKTTNTLVKQ